MFGQNPTRKQELGDGSKLFVQEIFHTIQGEGPLAGMPATFVRLSGCNLKCHFCDTDFESLRREMTVTEILDEVKRVTPTTTRWIVLTGGEPLIQNVVPLIRKLNHELQHQVQIESAGTVWIDGLADGLAIMNKLIVSPKTRRLHPMVVKNMTALKYIVKAGEIDPVDGLPFKSTQILGQDERVCRPWEDEATMARFKNSAVYVQACDEQDAEKNAANLKAAAESSMKFGYRLCVQLHKLVGLP